MYSFTGARALAFVHTTIQFMMRVIVLAFAGISLACALMGSVCVRANTPTCALTRTQLSVFCYNADESH